MSLNRYRPHPGEVIAEMETRGHAVFRSTTRPWNLNIIGVRALSPRMGEFGCNLMVLWPTERGWDWRRWPITTMPGAYYLRMKLLNPRGAAILAPGQYRGAYAVDYHRGEYLALCQRHGPVTVYRDGNRDNVFDLRAETLHRGWFGINIHRGKRSGRTEIVGKHSAGCQVFADAGDFEEFLDLCVRARREWGNRFTYTLL